MQYDLVYPGRPVPKGRPRFTKSGHVFTPRECVQAEQDITLQYIALGAPEFKGPIGVSVDFTETETTISIWEEDWNSRLRGDIDNYAKTVLDGLQGVAFKNDKQIVHLLARKL